MKNKIFKATIAGIAATALMSFLIIISSYLGFQRVAVWEIIANILGVSIILGWLIHFLIGILFALIYVFIKDNFKVFNGIFGGVFFGFCIFSGVQVFSLLFLGGGQNIFLVLGSLIGHLVYGAVVGMIAR